MRREQAGGKRVRDISEFPKRNSRDLHNQNKVAFS